MSQHPERSSSTSSESPSRLFSERQVDLILNNQIEEIRLKHREFDIRIKELDSADQISKHALEATAKDREQERKHNSNKWIFSLLIITLLIIVAVSSYIYLTLNDKDAAAQDLFTKLLLLITHIVAIYGGYTVGRSLERANSSRSDG